jgi:hypothetical protein
MLTQLATLKTRLALTTTDYDDLLTNAIAAVSARFEKECNRTFGRGEVNYEFPADQTEIVLRHYPLEAVLAFELKSDEDSGWSVQTNIKFVARRGCVLSLAEPLGTWRQQGNVAYLGGYVLPGDTPDPGQTPLPADLEQAAVEQCAAWFQNRDTLGLLTNRPHAGTYVRLSQLPLLPNVQAVLNRYRRWSV